MDLVSELVGKQKKTEEEKEKERKYRLANENFWEYCKLINPKFYKESRPHLKKIAERLQVLYEGRIIKRYIEDDWELLTWEQLGDLKLSGVDYIVCKKLMLNVPPRHGKSYIVTLFTQWMFGKDNENTVITVAYNEILSSRFSSGVRNGIDATKIDPNLNIFSDVFPTTKIKYGDSSKQIWSLEGQFFNYLGTGFGGTITGIGCRIGIIDDPVKNSEEAFNEQALENQWSWYTDTFLSRIEEGGLQIIIMTRWSKNDLCGKLLSSEEAEEWYELKMKACLDEEKGIMLCPELLSFKAYKSKKKLTSAEIHEANYQQEPVDVKGKLYSSFKTYTDFPKNESGYSLFTGIYAYTDTADDGRDYLCTIIFGVYNREAYILDVYYTQKPMEVTELEVARRFYEYGVNTAHVESNSGGKGFARQVESHLENKYNTNRTSVLWFHQSQNKKARIISNASWVMDHIYYPVNWANRWPEYFKAMNEYQREGKNAHDDAPDATTGVCEIILNKVTTRKRNYSGRGARA